MPFRAVARYRLEMRDTPRGGVVTGLAFGADLQTMSWDPDPAATGYDVFQGTISSGGFAYNHGCLMQVGTTSAADPSTPATGEVLYYAIASSNECGSGSLGGDSDGAGRPNPGCS